MASVTLTYGKKRSLLRSTGSVRRQKNLINHMPIKKSERIAPSVNTCHETVKQDHRTKGKVPAPGIDEIASAVLDDSIVEAHPRAVRLSEQGIPSPATNSKPSSISHSVPKSKSKSIVKQPGPSSSSALSVCSSKSRGSRRGHDLRVRASRIQKSPSKTSRRVAVRARGRAGSHCSPQQEHIGLQRPVQRPISADSHRANQSPLGSSGSPGFRDPNTMNSSPPAINEWKQSHPVQIHPHYSDQVQQKVCTMLATTDALKPSPSQFKTSSSTAKMARLVPSKVFARVSSAWDRLHSKSPDEGSRAPSRLRKQHPHDNSDALIPSTLCQSPTSRSTSSINTLEIRLNEGDNLNRKKVQKMVGGRVIRKPIPNDGRPVRYGRVLEDPFAEPPTTQNQDIVDDESRRSTEIHSDLSQYLSTGPFASEKGFEDDLQDRMLKTLPIGSSTPRAKARRVSALDLGDQPITSGLERPKPVIEALAIKLTEYQSSGRQTPDQNDGEIQDGNHDLPSTETYKARDEVDFKVVTGMKKHPSPSKRALEDLQAAFRQYSELKSCGAEDEVDELARQWAHPGLLYSRDKNQLMGIRLRARDCKLRGILDSGSEVESLTKPRLPCSMESRRNWRAPIRLAPAYRPLIPQADETDKLQ